MMTTSSSVGAMQNSYSLTEQLRGQQEERRKSRCCNVTARMARSVIPHRTLIKSFRKCTSAKMYTPMPT